MRRVTPGLSAFVSPFTSPLAALITLAVAWVVALVSRDMAAGGPAVGLWLLVVLPAPLLVAVLWGRAAWGERRVVRLLAALAVWLGAGHLLLSAADTWQMTANVAAGTPVGAPSGGAHRPRAAWAAAAPGPFLKRFTYSSATARLSSFRPARTAAR